MPNKESPEARLRRELAEANRRTDLAKIALRRANQWLSARIDDVDRLTIAVTSLREENRGLREGLLVPETVIPPSRELDRDTIEDARASLAL